MDDDYKVNKATKAPDGLHGSEAREWWRQARTHDLLLFCERYGHTVTDITPYQFRVNGCIDFYVTNGAWHDLQSGKRGDYHTVEDLKRLLK